MEKEKEKLEKYCQKLMSILKIENDGTIFANQRMYSIKLSVLKQLDSDGLEYANSLLKDYKGDKEALKNELSIILKKYVTDVYP